MAKEMLRIGAFAALSGISRKLLIFYDKNDILRPQFIDGENGYRYYSYRQIDTASVIVSLREAGMSLEEIRDYLAGKSPQRLIDMLDRQEDNILAQIQKLQRIRGMIRSRILQTQEGLGKGSGSVWVMESPAENLFVGPKLPEDYDLADGWKYLPAFYRACREKGVQTGFAVGTMVPQENVRRKRWNRPSHYFFRLPAGQYPDFYTKPAGTYLLGTAYADYGQVAPLYEKLLETIQSDRLQISGNAYEEYLIDEISEAEPARYLLQIAIQIENETG